MSPILYLLIGFAAGMLCLGAMLLFLGARWDYLDARDSERLLREN